MPRRNRLNKEQAPSLVIQYKMVRSMNMRTSSSAQTEQAILIYT